MEMLVMRTVENVPMVPMRNLNYFVIIVEDSSRKRTDTTSKALNNPDYAIRVVSTLHYDMIPGSAAGRARVPHPTSPSPLPPPCASPVRMSRQCMSPGSVSRQHCCELIEYVRIINPAGASVAVENTVSGEMIAHDCEMRTASINAVDGRSIVTCKYRTDLGDKKADLACLR